MIYTWHKSHLNVDFVCNLVLSEAWFIILFSTNCVVYVSEELEYFIHKSPKCDLNAPPPPFFFEIIIIIFTTHSVSMHYSAFVNPQAALFQFYQEIINLFMLQILLWQNSTKSFQLAFNSPRVTVLAANTLWCNNFCLFFSWLEIQYYAKLLVIESKLRILSEIYSMNGELYTKCSKSK